MVHVIEVSGVTAQYIPLALKALNYFYINHGDRRFFFKFESIINVLVSSF